MSLKIAILGGGSAYTAGLIETFIRQMIGL